MKSNQKFKRELQIVLAVMVICSLLIISSFAEENYLSQINQDSTRETWGIVIYQYRYWLGFFGLAILGVVYGVVYLMQSQHDETTLLQTQEELRKSKQLSQLVMDNIPQRICWKDCNSVYLGCNQNFANIAGLDHPNLIVGQTDYDLPWKKEESDFFRECDFRVMESDTAELGIVEPVKNGFEAVKEIRNLPEVKDTVIIAISASVMDLDRKKSRAIGCDSFLPKPVDEVELLTALQEHLQLDLIYEEIDAAHTNHLLKTEVCALQTLIAPPIEEMEILYELAMLGSMKKIHERAIYLGKLDEQYAPLANKLRDLAQSFQEKAIVNLIKQYLS